MRVLYHLLVVFLLSETVVSQEKIQTEVLVIGGTTGGIAAGIQSARMKVKTLVVEQTPWLGGMLTASGVSCTDGNDELWSGLWMEFREELYKHYKTRNLFSGWVSKTCFEPRVGDSLFKSMASREAYLNVLYGWYFDKVIKDGNDVKGALFRSRNGKSLTVNANITIDATDLGDGFADAGEHFDIGMEDPFYSRETMAPGKNTIIQDLTWAVVLEDFGKDSDMTISRPEKYDSTLFFCCNTNAPCNGKPWNGDAQKMLDYGRLTISPGNTHPKYMINWPQHGNDYYINVTETKPIERENALLAAKNKTLGFVYFLQTQLGYKNLGISREFPSDHGLALVPYHREGRRLNGVVRLNVNHLVDPFGQPQALYRTGISVGDYPVDHHHDPGKNAPDIDFPRVPSFNIPLGALIPAKVDGMVVCEKGISVSNIVNGATRLQPCVLLTGQAAGVLAALSVQKNCMPRAVAVREVQKELLKAKAYLMPYFDIRPNDKAWEAVQRVGATGMMKGKGIPEGWANKTLFFPDSTMRINEFKKILAEWYITNMDYVSAEHDIPITYGYLMKELNKFTVHRYKPERGIPSTKVLSRKEIAYWIDQYLDPFSKDVDLAGILKMD